MGTNYYLRRDACEHCGRSDDELHIGKSLTMFRGHFTVDDDDFFADIPWIVSWAQWKDHLRSAGGRIFDEYGSEHDVEEFIARVESTSPEARRRQFDRVVKHPRYGHETGSVQRGADWLDDDGFSFYGAEFS